MRTSEFVPPYWPPVSREAERLHLDVLLNPAGAFSHPADVIRDPDLTLAEKRAILASWASDACAVDKSLALRQLPGSRPVPFDDVMEALRELDKRAHEGQCKPRRYRHVLANRREVEPRTPVPHRAGGGPSTN